MNQIYFVLESMLKGRQSRKVANNTYVEKLGDGLIGLCLHSTYVVKATLNYVELDSGGWHTTTTMDRMRTAGIAIHGNGKRGWSVFKQYEVEGSFYTRIDWDSGGYPYWDGMRLDPYGNRPLPKADQPNFPDHWEPVITSSGWSGMTRAESRAARNAQYDALRSGDWETAFQIRDQLSGNVATLAPASIEETQLGTMATYHIDATKCPHFILTPEHYKADGACRCDDPSHIQMREWGYTWSEGKWN